METFKVNMSSKKTKKKTGKSLEQMVKRSNTSQSCLNRKIHQIKKKSMIKYRLMKTNPKIIQAKGKIILVKLQSVTISKKVTSRSASKSQRAKPFRQRLIWQLRQRLRTTIDLP
jgi:hypothetical protein